jgi:hypothetical protein
MRFDESSLGMQSASRADTYAPPRDLGFLRRHVPQLVVHGPLLVEPLVDPQG